MVKLITLLKRRPGLSREAFRDYYESRHRLIGEKYLAGYAVHYVRRYVELLPGGGEPDHDVVMEIWLPDRERLEALMRRLAEPDVAEEIARDEEQLFDRPATLTFTVSEVASTLN